MTFRELYQKESNPILKKTAGEIIRNNRDVTHENMLNLLNRRIKELKEKREQAKNNYGCKSIQWQNLVKKGTLYEDALEIVKAYKAGG